MGVVIIPDGFANVTIFPRSAPGQCSHIVIVYMVFTVLYYL